MGSVEKAKDAREVTMRLLNYFSEYKLSLVFVIAVVARYGEAFHGSWLPFRQFPPYPETSPEGQMLERLFVVDLT